MSYTLVEVMISQLRRYTKRTYTFDERIAGYVKNTLTLLKREIFPDRVEILSEFHSVEGFSVIQAAFPPFPDVFSAIQETPVVCLSQGLQRFSRTP